MSERINLKGHSFKKCLIAQQKEKRRDSSELLEDENTVVFEQEDDDFHKVILHQEGMELQLNEGENVSKWSDSDIQVLLEVLGKILDSEEGAGGLLSRKNLFSAVSETLGENGVHFTSLETEKKYNNMNMTYRRCLQKIRDGKCPSWPYFKKFEAIRSKDLNIRYEKSNSSSRLKDAPSTSKSTVVLEPERESGPLNTKDSEAAVPVLDVLKNLVKDAKEVSEHDSHFRQIYRQLDDEELNTLVQIRDDLRSTRVSIVQSFKDVKNAIRGLGEFLN